MSQIIQLWSQKLKETLLPKIYKLFQNRKKVAISLGVFGGTLIIIWFIKHPSVPFRRKRSHNPNANSLSTTGIDQIPNLGPYPPIVTINPRILANMKKSTVNLEDLSTTSQSDRGGYERDYYSARYSSSDYYGSERSYQTDQRTSNNTRSRKEVVEDPDELFFNIFQSVNQSLK